jgi:hypothetical protein
VTRDGSSRPWRTLAAGAMMIVGAEAMLLVDVRARGGAMVPHDPLPDPAGAVEAFARFMSVSTTPLCWLGFMLVADGILARRGGSPLRQRPRRFLVCAITSIPVWLFFDWVNFSFMHAWAYHGLPANALHLYAGYAISFAAITPAMLMSAELLQRLGVRRLRGPAVPFGPRSSAALVALGIAFIALPFALRDPIANLTLWVAPIMVLDPINRAIGVPSVTGDLARARPGRLAALMLGGLACGLLWEFWNYWAAAKWTYDLPFLGPLERWRYFEMPLPGLLGFVPFGPSCWVAFHTLVAALRGAGLRVEPLPDDDAVL